MITTRIDKIAIERLLQIVNLDGKRTNACTDVIIIDDKAQTVTLYNQYSGYTKTTYCHTESAQLDF